MLLGTEYRLRVHRCRIQCPEAETLCPLYLEQDLRACTLPGAVPAVGITQHLIRSCSPVSSLSVNMSVYKAMHLAPHWPFCNELLAPGLSET